MIFSIKLLKISFAGLVLSTAFLLLPLSSPAFASETLSPEQAQGLKDLGLQAVTISLFDVLYKDSTRTRLPGVDFNDVKKLLSNNIPEDIIKLLLSLDLITGKFEKLNLGPDDIIILKKAGISHDVIRIILKTQIKIVGGNAPNPDQHDLGIKVEIREDGKKVITYHVGDPTTDRNDKSRQEEELLKAQKLLDNIQIDNIQIDNIQIIIKRSD